MFDLRQRMRRALDGVVIMHEAAACGPLCKRQRRAGNDIGLDTTILTIFAMEQQVRHRRCGDTQPLGRSAIILARAAQQAGLLQVPVVVRDVPDDKLLELALIENLQRENLNPIEEAEAYRRLIDDYQVTQEQVAAAVGKDRTTVANYVRLLALPPEVQADMAAGVLAMGHARALLGLREPSAQRRAAREVVARGLSVRETEGLVKRLGRPTVPRPSGLAPPLDVHTEAAQDRLRVALGTRVRIVRRGQKGRIEIDFASQSELQRLFEHLTGSETGR